eukprot:479793_1
MNRLSLHYTCERRLPWSSGFGETLDANINVLAEIHETICQCLFISAAKKSTTWTHLVLMENEARRVQLEVSRMCRYTKKNAENITHSAFQLIAAYLSYRLVFLLLKTIIVGIVKMMQGKKSKVVVTEKTI